MGENGGSRQGDIVKGTGVRYHIKTLGKRSISFVIFTKTGLTTTEDFKKSQPKIKRPRAHEPNPVGNRLNKSKFQDESDWTCNQWACSRSLCNWTSTFPEVLEHYRYHLVQLRDGGGHCWYRLIQLRDNRGRCYCQEQFELESPGFCWQLWP